MKANMMTYRLLIACVGVWIALSISAIAQPSPATGSTSAQPARQLIIGTRVVPPFAFKDAKGEWTGITIELWRDIAARLKLDYRFEEVQTVKELVAGVAEKRFDAGAAALTVTEERETSMDFSHPFFSTGLAIATGPNKDSAVWAAIKSFISWQTVLIAIVVMGGISAIGMALSSIERRKGNADFDTAGEGLWASVTMFLTSQFTAPEPKSFAGRALATFWVVVSIGAMTFLTGIVTSALTVQSLEGHVRGLNDLPNLRVGDVAGSTGQQWLAAERIRAAPFDNIADGLKAITEDRIDAFVHDAPILQYLAQGEYADKIVVLPDNFAPQDYAIAFPDGSPLREPVNRELIAIKRSDAWKKRVFEYLGSR